MESFLKRNAFVTLKDHKENFQFHPKCRLINPAKSETDKISKQHQDSINTEVRKKSRFNQRKHTASTLSWFNNIPSSVWINRKINRLTVWKILTINLLILQ